MRALSEIKLPDMSGGLNTHDPEYEIADNQSPDMLNLWYKNKALCKRPGQVMVVKNIPNVHRISDEFCGMRIVHAGTKLYRWDEAGARNYRGTFSAAEGYPEPPRYPEPMAGDFYEVAGGGGTIAGTEYLEGDIAIYAGSWHKSAEEIAQEIGDVSGVFVEFGDVMYYIDGSEIWQIGADFRVKAVEPYAPVIMINCRPDLSESDDSDPYNLLGGGFCVKYNGDGVLAVYELPVPEGEDLTADIEIVIDAVTVQTGFSFDSAEGTVTFSSAPPKGTNNVWITAYIADPDGSRKKRITGCKAAVAFGGESGGLTGGTRVFVTANPDYPLSHWHSDLGLHVGSGMGYFPDTGEEYLDQNGEAITAAAKMGSELVIFKKSSVFSLRYAFDGQDAFFPVRECNSVIGCDIPGSIQLIDNRLVFANTRSGVYMLISTSNEREDLIKPLSANVNSLLLMESGLEQACSCDYERYYWLCVNGRVYLWDYEQTPYYNYSDYEQAQKRLAWYRFSNINADVFCAGQKLYYGAENGIAGLTNAKDDFGKPIDAYFLSKAFDLGRPEELKTFMFAYPSFSPDGNIKVSVTVGSEDTDEIVSRDFDIKSFSWSDFNWRAFTWETIKYAKTFSMRLGIKKVSYVQVKVSGSDIGRGVGLSGLRLTYYGNRKVKR